MVQGGGGGAVVPNCEKEPCLPVPISHEELGALPTAFSASKNRF